MPSLALEGDQGRPLNDQAASRNRDSLLLKLFGGTVTIRVDLLIITILLLGFFLISLHTFTILQRAFQEVYARQAENGSTSNREIQLASKQEPVFHSEYFSPQVTRWETAILQWAEQYSLPPDLIAIVMQIESCGDQLASSSAGAMGIFQVMPFHFEADENPYDPQVNAARGLDYLARGYAKSGESIELALAGYNGGHTMIDKPSTLWPQETQRYVIWGIGIWEDIHAGKHPSPTLEKWLIAGGKRLCSAAPAAAN